MTDAPVLTEIAGCGLVITLNRPDALNALSAEMVTHLDTALDCAEADPQIRHVVIKGAGPRAFCAGGDIRFLLDSREDGGAAAADFWAREYRLNARIARFAKPYIALIDGICMGGGVGVAGHGALRIVTEAAKVAMPETGIGFIPDVGATWLLTRQDSAIARYMALTGAAVGPADAIAAGLADLCIPQDRLPAFETALARGDDPKTAAAALAISPPAGLAALHAQVLQQAFADDDIAAIRARLAQSDDAFAQETAALLERKSPIALQAAAVLLARARRSASLRDCLNAEFRAAMGALFHPDFAEGVRAAIIDKDRNPRWSPATAAEVTPAALAAFLSPDSITRFAAPF